MTIILVAIAAFAGAVCRYLVDRAVQHRTEAVLPLGTLTVNLTGSFALGFLVGLGLYHGLGDDVRTVVGTGFVGTYTTFSTFAYETVRLPEDGSTLEAFATAAASTAPGLLAASAGLALAGDHAARAPPGRTWRRDGRTRPAPVAAPTDPVQGRQSSSVPKPVPRATGRIPRQVLGSDVPACGEPTITTARCRLDSRHVRAVADRLPGDHSRPPDSDEDLVTACSTVPTGHPERPGFGR